MSLLRALLKTHRSLILATIAILIVATIDITSVSAAGLVSYWPGYGDATDVADGNDGILVGGTACREGESVTCT